MFYSWFLKIFLIRQWISALRRPITATLCHVINFSVDFMKQVQKFIGPYLKKFRGQKHAKISANFTQLQTLIANISGMTKDIQNRKDMWSRTITFRVQRNKSGELWSTIHEVEHVLKLVAEDPWQHPCLRHLLNVYFLFADFSAVVLETECPILFRCVSV